MRADSGGQVDFRGVVDLVAGYVGGFFDDEGENRGARLDEAAEGVEKAAAK